MTSSQNPQTDRPQSAVNPGRVLLKAALLFLLLNLLFALTYPLEALGQVSLYNWLLPGRDRLPYGENAAESYNLSLNNLPAMFASHTVSQGKAANEYRVLIIGDSGTWGWFLANDHTLAGQLNAAQLTTADGRRVVAYNLGYPILAVSKDLLILDQAMAYQPDLILWPVTLDSLYPPKQLTHPLLQNNPGRVRNLITTYQLNLDPHDPRFVDPTFLDRTIVGQRRALADLLRLQAYGISWAATGIDQAIPAEIPLRKSDFEADESWQDYETPTNLRPTDLSLDVLAAGLQVAGRVPLLLVNEPMFISSGTNSDLRYNSFYPRWAYDQYRQLLAAAAAGGGWRYLDLWNAIPPDEFTDTPVHLTPAGTRQLATLLSPAILAIANQTE